MLTKTRWALSLVLEHIEQQSPEPALVSLLIDQIVIMFYSEVETTVEGIIKAHLLAHGKKHIATFIHQTNQDMIRRVKKSDISSFLKLFGAEFKEQFNDRLDEVKANTYSNLIANRHTIAHSSSSNLSIIEVQSGIDAGFHVLETLQFCLDLAE